MQTEMWSLIIYLKWIKDRKQIWISTLGRDVMYRSQLGIWREIPDLKARIRAICPTEIFMWAVKFTARKSPKKGIPSQWELLYQYQFWYCYKSATSEYCGEPVKTLVQLAARNEVDIGSNSFTRAFFFTVKIRKPLQLEESK